MKARVRSLLAIALMFSAADASARCDEYLRASRADARSALLFARDCRIQERYERIESFFRARGVSLSQLAEYRMIRFIDRASLERAKTNQTHPSDIYEPKPTTWNVWSAGIDKLFAGTRSSSSRHGSSIRAGVATDRQFDFAEINRVLLSNEMGYTSRYSGSRTGGHDMVPGVLRSDGDPPVGFETANAGGLGGAMVRSLNSMARTQRQWEQAYGQNFQQIVAARRGLFAEQASFGVSMLLGDPTKSNHVFVAYAPSTVVSRNVHWLSIFIDVTMDSYNVGKPLMPPIEFSALTQKWLVTIHPFADGNGRTSRAVQDLILSRFRMPYAPAGDLQNDVLDEYDVYVEKTYQAMDRLMGSLEQCQREYALKNGVGVSYACTPVDQLE